jgi:signal peptidase
MWGRTSAGGRHRQVPGQGTVGRRLDTFGLRISDLMSDIRDTVLACVVGMVLTATAPAVFGWHTTVVVSGSMYPRIKPGDVVAARPVPASKRAHLALGTIVLVKNPAEPHELLMHRLVRYDAQDRLITKGDTNAAADSTPVPLANVLGVARLRVPFVGLPVLWVRQRRYLPAAATAILLLTLVLWQSQSRPYGEPHGGRARTATHGPGRSLQGAHRAAEGKPTAALDGTPGLRSD